MKITIENFRCFSGKESPAEREFEESSVNLFSGVSGKGKSSTFYAMIWCLFGKMKGIKPIDQPEKRLVKGCCEQKTRVILEFDGMTIMREKKPESLILEEDEKLYEGKIAQEKIYQLFGDEDLFIATSFLQQKGKHPLVYLSCPDRFSLLYNLTFGYSSNEKFTPENYLIHVSKEILSRSSELKSLEGVTCYLREKYNSEKLKFKDFEEQFQIFSGLDELQRAKDILKEEISLLQGEVKSLEKDKVRYYQSKGKKELLEENLKRDLPSFEKAKKLFEGLTDVPEIRIESLSARIDKLEKIKSIQDEIENLDIHEIVLELDANKVSETTNACVNADKFLKRFKIQQFDEGARLAKEIILQQKKHEKLLKEEESRQDRYQENIEILKREYAEKQLENLKKTTKNEQLKIYKDNLKVREEYFLEFEKIEKLRLGYKEEYAKFNLGDTLPNAKTLEKKIESISRTLECLKCPECEISLTVKDKILVKVLDPAEREALELSRDSLRKFHQKLLQLELRTVRLGPEPKKMKTPDLKDLEFDEIQILDELKIPEYIPSREYSGLEKRSTSDVILAEKFISGIELIPRNIKLARLLNDFPNYSIHKRLEKKLEDLGSGDSVESLEILTQEYNQLVKLRKDYLTARRNFEGYKRDIDKTTRELEECEIVIFEPEKLEEKEEDLKNKRHFLGKMIEYIACEETREDLESRTCYAKKIEDQVEILTDLKKIAEAVSIESINERIICLEQTTNTLLAVLFEDKPINVSIKAVKESKTKTSEKNQVNMTIFRNSNELKMLSGGENSRFNLALTIAMNLISGSKVLFLDEVLDGIEEELKEATIRLVKKYCFMKTVIFICHNSVKGMYDNVVTLA